MSDATGSWLRVERDGHVVTVTLDRPPVNAVNDEVFLEIRDVFRSFDDDREARAVIFTAAGERAFMGGADLNWIGQRGAGEDPPASRVTDKGRLTREAMWAVLHCAVPVVGAINGPAIGAGVAFAACCDILLASERASFGTLEINVGLLGASSHLTTMVGRYKAREMFFLGEKVPASEMHRLGVVREVVPPAELMPKAMELARELASKSPIALRLAKESMNRIEHLPLEEAYRIEQDYTARLQTFEDSREARQAYLEKREPDWKWR